MDKIVRQCTSHPIRFHHIGGKVNPADKVTRCVSARVLAGTCYLTGPEISNELEMPILTVPPPMINTTSCMTAELNLLEATKSTPVLEKTCRVVHFVRKFILLRKQHYNDKNQNLFLGVNDAECSYADTVTLVIRKAQEQSFPNVVRHLLNPSSINLRLCPLVTQLNLVLDEDQIVKVRSKMSNLNSPIIKKYPILLGKDSMIASGVIRDMHHTCKHGGVYKLLTILRR